MNFILLEQRIINTNHISFIEKDKIWFDDNSYISINKDEYLRLKNILVCVSSYQVIYIVELSGKI